MENINWDKLQPYSGDSKKSFKELCYQIVSEKFKNDILNGVKKLNHTGEHKKTEYRNYYKIIN